MEIADFAGLLAAAKAQAEPQRLLFVFAAAELPRNHTQAQKERYQARAGGTLAPVLCVDKAPEDIASFAALAAESRATGRPWDLVFVAALSGQGGVAPSPETADKALRRMVDAVGNGQLGSFLAYSLDGEPVQFD